MNKNGSRKSRIKPFKIPQPAKYSKCLICNKSIVVIRSTKKYCSDACRLQGYMEKKLGRETGYNYADAIRLTEAIDILNNMAWPIGPLEEEVINDIFKRVGKIEHNGKQYVVAKK